MRGFTMIFVRLFILVLGFLGAMPSLSLCAAGKSPAGRTSVSISYNHRSPEFNAFGADLNKRFCDLYNEVRTTMNRSLPADGKLPEIKSLFFTGKDFLKKGAIFYSLLRNDDNKRDPQIKKLSAILCQYYGWQFVTRVKGFSFVDPSQSLYCEQAFWKLYKLESTQHEGATTVQKLEDRTFIDQFKRDVANFVLMDLMLRSQALNDPRADLKVALKNNFETFYQQVQDWYQGGVERHIIDPATTPKVLVERLCLPFHMRFNKCTSRWNGLWSTLEYASGCFTIPNLLATAGVGAAVYGVYRCVQSGNPQINDMLACVDRNVPWLGEGVRTGVRALQSLLPSGIASATTQASATTSIQSSAVPQSAAAPASQSPAVPASSASAAAAPQGSVISPEAARQAQIVRDGAAVTSYQMLTEPGAATNRVAAAAAVVATNAAVDTVVERGLAVIDAGLQQLGTSREELGRDLTRASGADAQSATAAVAAQAARASDDITVQRTPQRVVQVVAQPEAFSAGSRIMAATQAAAHRGSGRPRRYAPVPSWPGQPDLATNVRTAFSGITGPDQASMTVASQPAQHSVSAASHALAPAGVSAAPTQLARLGQLAADAVTGPLFKRADQFVARTTAQAEGLIVPLNQTAQQGIAAVRPIAQLAERINAGCDALVSLPADLAATHERVRVENQRFSGPVLPRTVTPVATAPIDVPRYEQSRATAPRVDRAATVAPSTPITVVVDDMESGSPAVRESATPSTAPSERLETPLPVRAVGPSWGTALWRDTCALVGRVATTAQTICGLSQVDDGFDIDNNPPVPARSDSAISFKTAASPVASPVVVRSWTRGPEDMNVQPSDVPQAAMDLLPADDICAGSAASSRSDSAASFRTVGSPVASPVVVRSWTRGPTPEVQAVSPVQPAATPATAADEVHDGRSSTASFVSAASE